MSDFENDTHNPITGFSNDHDHTTVVQFTLWRAENVRDAIEMISDWILSGCPADDENVISVLSAALECRDDVTDENIISELLANG